jgi:psiF repeat-containing protein
MRKLILLIALATLSAPVLAANSQQEKMKTCSADAKAKGLKGEEYTKFKNECLKAKPDASAATSGEKTLTPQQEKMKKCSADAKAKGLKGDEYKKFNSACLKG